MVKTNKAVSKRIKVTPNGKVLRRSQNQNHFNAKESGSTQSAKKGWKSMPKAKKIVNKYLHHN